MALKEIVLKGEQKKVLFLSATEPIQIKGVAGSGKTTIALYRAKHLLETQNNLFQEAKVIIFTFNKTLTAYIEATKYQISGGYQQDSDIRINRSKPGLNVRIVNFHSWAYQFLTNRGINAWVDLNTLSNLKNEIVNNLKIALIKENPTSNILKKKVDFFLEEISWMKGRLLLTQYEYLNAKRTGRGTSDRVTKNDRELIWKIFDGYNKRMKEVGKIEYDDYAILCLNEIDKDPSFTHPYTHIIVDEAQDLSKAQILTISKIVSPSTKSISIIADAAQRIYKSAFSWSEVGIEVRGNRTLILKKNYRNTEAILLAAISLLSHDPDPSEFTEAEPDKKGGKKPIIGYFSNWEKEANYLIKELNKIDHKEESTVILHRDWKGIKKINDLMTQNRIDSEIINEKDAICFSNDKIKICTLSSIKGLEFENVFIIDLNDDIIPSPSGFVDDDYDVQISTERRLLYTSMTRAKERLFLLSSGNHSRYLFEIEKNKIEELGDSVPR